MSDYVCVVCVCWGRVVVVLYIMGDQERECWGKRRLLRGGELLCYGAAELMMMMKVLFNDALVVVWSWVCNGTVVGMMRKQSGTSQKPQPLNSLFIVFFHLFLFALLLNNYMGTISLFTLL